MNLNQFQIIFNEDNTEIRFRKVLDEISPIITPLFERFAETLDIALGSKYYVRSYDSTLTATYHDSRNPKYAEQKVNSDIGRKYYIGLYRKVKDKENNIFMLEFNGIDGSMLKHIELSLIPFWAWIKNGKFKDVLESIPVEYSILTGWKEKEAIPRDNFESFVKSCIKLRKCPWFQIGIQSPMNET